MPECPHSPPRRAGLRRDRDRHHAAEGLLRHRLRRQIGHARQMAVAGDGTVFVNTWSGVYYNNDTPPEGGFLVALKDTKGTGKADHVERFGADVRARRQGRHRHLHLQGLGLRRAQRQDRTLRAQRRRDHADGQAGDDPQRHADHRRPPDASVHHRQGRQPVRLHGLGDQHMRGEEPHAAARRGNDPCTELETRAGVWRYDANKTGQVFSPKERYATASATARASTSTPPVVCT